MKTEQINSRAKVNVDYFGRVVDWIAIKKKPLMYSIGLPPNVCSKCGKLYMDTWSQFCSLDGKWLISTELLDFKHRKLIGFDKQSHQPKM